jgi:hypothetical protein
MVNNCEIIIMGTVRKFQKDDIPQIVELNTRLFPESSTLSYDIQKDIFEEACFRNPWFDPDISSLVHIESDGRISGFMAVIHRQMVFEGKLIRVGVSQHMMSEKSTLASLQLKKQFFNGPQDLSFTDRGVDVSRTIWERLGGVTVYHGSIYWRRPFRPFVFAASILKKNKSDANKILGQIVSAGDVILSNIPFNPLRSPKPSGYTRDLTIQEFLDSIPRFSSFRKLHPSYDHKSIEWLFYMLEKEKRFGSFRKKAVYDDSDRLLGWYLYNLKTGGRSEVIQIAAEPRTIKQVLAHLYYEAWFEKTVELCGRLDPHFMKEFSDRFNLFIPGRNWMCIHSRNQEIMKAIQAGDAFLSRLEGDLWFF